MPAVASRPLEGVKVVDLSAVVSGPLCTTLLADQGAEVVKVEPPGIGDILRFLGSSRGGMTGMFAVTNRGKRSIALDLGDDRGKEALGRLVAGADVFVQNFRPGVVDRMGIGEAAMRARNPDLVYVSISGFGDTGPYAGKRVYDNIVQAYAGVAAVQADPTTGQAALVRNLMCDKVTALTAAQAITAALFARERGAGGTHLRLAMLDAAIAFLWPDGMSDHTLLGDGIAHQPTIASFYRVAELADGQLTITFLSDAEWGGLCRAFERPDLAADPRFTTIVDRMANAPALVAALEELATGASLAPTLARLDAEQVAAAPVRTLEEIPSDPQVLANATLVEGDHPLAGAMRQPRPPTRFGDELPAPAGAAPALGQHTDEVLAELGYDVAAIAQLRAAGVAS